MNAVIKILVIFCLICQGQSLPYGNFLNACALTLSNLNIQELKILMENAKQNRYKMSVNRKMYPEFYLEHQLYEDSKFHRDAKRREMELHGAFDQEQEYEHHFEKEHKGVPLQTKVTEPLESVSIVDTEHQPKMIGEHHFTRKNIPDNYEKVDSQKSGTLIENEQKYKNSKEHHSTRKHSPDIYGEIDTKKVQTFTEKEQKYKNSKQHHPARKNIPDNYEKVDSQKSDTLIEKELHPGSYLGHNLGKDSKFHNDKEDKTYESVEQEQEHTSSKEHHREKVDTLIETEHKSKTTEQNHPVDANTFVRNTEEHHIQKKDTPVHLQAPVNKVQKPTSTEETAKQILDIPQEQRNKLKSSNKDNSVKEEQTPNPIVEHYFEKELHENHNTDKTDKLVQSLEEVQDEQKYQITEEHHAEKEDAHVQSEEEHHRENNEDLNTENVDKLVQSVQQEDEQKNKITEEHHVNVHSKEEHHRESNEDRNPETEDYLVQSEEPIQQVLDTPMEDEQKHKITEEHHEEKEEDASVQSEEEHHREMEFTPAFSDDLLWNVVSYLENLY